MSDLYIPVSVGVATTNDVAKDVNTSGDTLGVVPLLAVASIVATAVKVGISVTSTIMAEENRRKALAQAELRNETFETIQEFTLDCCEGYNGKVYEAKEKLFIENSYLAQGLSGYSLNDRMTYIDYMSSIQDGIVKYWSVTDHLGFYRMMENLNRKLVKYYDAGGTKEALLNVDLKVAKTAKKVVESIRKANLAINVVKGGAINNGILNAGLVAGGVLAGSDSEMRDEVARISYKLALWGLALHIDSNGVAGIDFGRIAVLRGMLDNGVVYRNDDGNIDLHYMHKIPFSTDKIKLPTDGGIFTSTNSINVVIACKHNDKRLAYSMPLSDYYDEVRYNQDGTIDTFTSSFSGSKDYYKWSSTQGRLRSGLKEYCNVFKDRLDWAVSAGVPAWIIRSYNLGNGAFDTGEAEAGNDIEDILSYVKTLREEREAKTEEARLKALKEQEKVIQKKKDTSVSGTTTNRVKTSVSVTTVDKNTGDKKTTTVQEEKKVSILDKIKKDKKLSIAIGVGVGAFLLSKGK